jgi:hypothetical protein
LMNLVFMLAMGLTRRLKILYTLTAPSIRLQHAP